jgi:acetolactate synthase-1/3 small subunit
MRHQHLQSLHVLANQFGARIVDVSEDVRQERCVEAFFSLVKPFAITHDVVLFTSIADPGYPPLATSDDYGWVRFVIPSRSYTV